MKTLIKVIFVMIVLAVAAIAFAKFTGAAIVNSTINSTTLGATTPSTAAVTQFAVNTGVTNSGTGFKHVRATSCTTPASAGGFCTGTVSWPGAAFADVNYTFGCIAIGSGQATFLVGSTPTTTGITAEVMNSSGNSAAVSVTLDCWAMHD
jgi:hypothetical protein